MVMGPGEMISGAPTPNPPPGLCLVRLTLANGIGMMSTWSGMIVHIARFGILGRLGSVVVRMQG